MNFISLIEAKRDGVELTPGQLSDFISAYAFGRIPDYQVSAFLMAVFFRGLTSRETSALTLAMRDSGDVLKLPKDPRPVVDKHSTGGVGDKVSLPLAPLLACLGFRVPMISGRGLGITGGTLDKLDSIPGFRTSLPATEIVQTVQDTGCIICGQTSTMVPADKAMYALRDVTGTVPSQPLIVASILSKKLAEGLDALVLDVKHGAAAFMPTIEKARELADAMVQLGNECGVKTHAILNSMDAPLGTAAGNWLEVVESVDCLEGRGPADLHRLVIECAAELLMLAGGSESISAARNRAEDCLRSGAPRRKWNEMLQAQGVDLEAFERKLAAGPAAPVIREIRSHRSGTVRCCDARVIGEAVRDLGGGRMTKESTINYDVGIDQLAQIGEQVKSGDTLVRVHAASESSFATVSPRLHTALSVQ